MPATADVTKFERFSDHTYDITAGVHSLFVYTNIVKPSFVGDSFSQLLRVCEVPPIEEYGRQVNIQYTSPYFIPLAENEIELIEIDIKDGSGENIPFEYGRVIVTLEFKRVG